MKRVLPHSVEAEQSVIGSMLMDKDATDYTIYTQVWDTWTPDGMLSINLNDYVSIQGSLYDDWYTNRE